MVFEGSTLAVSNLFQCHNHPSLGQVEKGLYLCRKKLVLLVLPEAGQVLLAVQLVVELALQLVAELALQQALRLASLLAAP
eukprot:CAMPEP_0172418242 /NCGR_PEP_ID=MMETSP1064-20121228/4760_1 /TAXON_ID=202472 /ORGANISM="Aulacoseira subarctica , Strain CCAP 1002/5" /LENGTH=80 /DNA_ID=CAMNT_0013157083 /DNA_START=81 /DNA_END=320 /DNA_ORIENTATION=-